MNSKSLDFSNSYSDFNSNNYNNINNEYDSNSNKYYNVNNLYDKNNNNSSNILNNSTTLNLSDFERIQLEKQYNRLYENSINTNNNEIDKRIQERIYNLSLKTIANNTAITFMNILNDITIYIKESDKTLDNFMFIFVKDNRLIYLGIIFIILSLLLFIINLGK